MHKLPIFLFSMLYYFGGS